MKRNKMCPICFIKQLFAPRRAVTDIYNRGRYDNGAALTPPMGWSSWNTFANTIDQDLIIETANAMVKSGLKDAGYSYINLDDNWMSNERDSDGLLQGDYTKFSRGIPDLVTKVNALGLKLGIYTSNGTLTCEDLPASLGREWQDAYTFAKWGIEYFKYDFCHNIPHSRNAPLVYGLSIAKVGDSQEQFVSAIEAKVFGTAKIRKGKNIPTGKMITGMDGNMGYAVFDNIVVDSDGQYVVTLNIKKFGGYEKFIMLTVNEANNYEITFPPQNFHNDTARFQTKVELKKGNNTIKMFNPIGSKADSAMLQYQYMGRQLIEATNRVAKETNQPNKPIVFSICEWGANQPYKWGNTAGNLWRTTPDIKPYWFWMRMIYEWTVGKYNYAGIGSYNDPDMLEVGNPRLTKDENLSHFAVWCMINAPLILGNDLRVMSREVLDIVTNKSLIEINQDKLCKAAKRVVKGKVDVLARPLSNGDIAVCFFNKRGGKSNVKLQLGKLATDKYVGLPQANKYLLTDLIDGQRMEVGNCISTSVNRHGARVYRLSVIK